VAGGAVKFTGKKPIIKEDNFFVNNTAVYGPDHASYSVKLRVVSESKFFRLSGVDTGIELNQSIYIQVLDHFGQRVLTVDG
jgi:hypothetical protein